MTIINNIDGAIFEINGAKYLKNFISVINGDRVKIVNVYDSRLELQCFKHFSEFTVNGNTFASAFDLQTALLPILFTRSSLNGIIIESDIINVTYTRPILTFILADNTTVNIDLDFVQSVTGQGVDNSDPLNPVININPPVHITRDTFAELVTDMTQGALIKDFFYRSLADGLFQFRGLSDPPNPADLIPVGGNESSTLHNTIIGGVGGTITNKVLLASQLTGVIANDISNFYLDGLDVYAQINKNYTDIGTGIRQIELTSYIDRQGRYVGTPAAVEYINLTALTTIIFNGITLIVGDSTFQGCTALIYFEASNLKQINNNGIYQDTAIKTFIAPSLRFVTAGGLRGTSVNYLPLLETLNAANGQGSFLNSTAATFSFPNVRSIGVEFQNTNSATVIYLPNCKEINDNGHPAHVFSGNSANKTIIVHSDLSTANAGQEHAALASARASGATIVYHQTVPTGLPTGTEIRFITPQIYNSATTPATGNITNDLTGALQGVVQKIYHNHSAAPTVPAGWVLMGAGTYVENELNIIYAEFAGGSRVEYWIVNEA